MDEEQSVSELMPVQRNAELDMLCGLPFLLVERSKPFRIISMHVLIKFLKITSTLGLAELGLDVDCGMSPAPARLPKMPKPSCSESSAAAAFFAAGFGFAVAAAGVVGDECCVSWWPEDFLGVGHAAAKATPARGVVPVCEKSACNLSFIAA